LVIAYCWYILLGLADLTAGRAVDVALWTAGRNILAIEAMVMYFKQRRMKGKEIRTVAGRAKDLEV